MKILFVCTGNTCRSPMAEALIKHKAPGMEVQSAGIFAGKNQRANHHTIEVLRQKGIALNHRSQPVTDKLLNWADLVLTMTTQHKQSLIMEYPNFQDHYFTLKEYLSENDKTAWTELKKAYAELEEKRSVFVQENQHKLNNYRLEHALNQHLSKDLLEIQQLESSLTNYDVSDPFGGELETYRATLDELEKYIDVFLKKLNGN